MKKLITGITVVLCVFLVGCFDFQFGNDIVNKWFLIGEYILLDSTTTQRINSYSSDIDEYYDAFILNITDSLIIRCDKSYNYLTREPITIDTAQTYTISGDTLYLKGVRWPSIIKREYYFNDHNHLVLKQIGTGWEQHFQKYDHEIPPESWLVEIPDDDYESDNSIQDASDIRINIRQDHTITAHDTDHVKFQAKAGQGYLIQGLAYFNIEMLLMDEEGDTIIYDRGGNEFRHRIKNLSLDLSSLIPWECNASGTYYLRTNGAPISEYLPTRVGYYQTKVEKYDLGDIEYWY